MMALFPAKSAVFLTSGLGVEGGTSLMLLTAETTVPSVAE
jgi:hypothetical protein